MNTPYEILLRSKDGLTVTGAHAIDKPGEKPRPVRPADLAAFGKTLNAAALATLAEQQVAIEGHAAAIKEKDAALSAAFKARDAAMKERDAAGATLAEHQAISDALAKQAGEAIAKGDAGALRTILTEATTFGLDREKRKLAAAAAAKRAEAEAMEAQLAAL